MSQDDLLAIAHTTELMFSKEGPGPRYAYYTDDDAFIYFCQVFVMTRKFFDMPHAERQVHMQLVEFEEWRYWVEILVGDKFPEHGGRSLEQLNQYTLRLMQLYPGLVRRYGKQIRPQDDPVAYARYLGELKTSDEPFANCERVGELPDESMIQEDADEIAFAEFLDHLTLEDARTVHYNDPVPALPLKARIEASTPSESFANLTAQLYLDKFNLKKAIRLAIHYIEFRLQMARLHVDSKVRRIVDDEVYQIEMHVMDPTWALLGHWIDETKFVRRTADDDSDVTS